MRKTISILLSAAMLTASAVMPAMAEEDIKVLVNGEAVVFTDAEPFIEDGRTLVPMRAIFEALGAQVEWDDETRTIVSYDPTRNVSIVMQIDSNIMIVDEKAVELEVPAKIVNDRTVVPVRAIAEGMSCAVDWDDEARTVTVAKGSTRIANPWTDYDSLEALNKDMEYDFPDISVGGLVPTAFRQLNTQELSEVSYLYSEGAGVTVRLKRHSSAYELDFGRDDDELASFGIEDISGIYGSKKIDSVERVEDYFAQLVEIYSVDYSEGDITTLYGLTYVMDSDSYIYDCTVAVESGALSQDEMITLIKRIIPYISLYYDQSEGEYETAAELNDAADIEFPEIKNEKLSPIFIGISYDIPQIKYTYSDDIGTEVTLFMSKEGFWFREYSEPSDSIEVGNTEIEPRKGYDEWEEKNLMSVVFDNDGAYYAIRIKSDKLTEEEMTELIKSIAEEIITK